LCKSPSIKLNCKEWLSLTNNLLHCEWSAAMW
jgi:hypothetical protein